MSGVGAVSLIWESPQNETTMEPALTMSEAMALANIKSRNTMKKYIRTGEIAAKRLPGGHWRFSVEDIETFLRDDTRAKALDHLRRLRA